jgi:hypothetical protein
VDAVVFALVLGTRKLFFGDENLVELLSRKNSDLVEGELLPCLLGKDASHVDDFGRRRLPDEDVSSTRCPSRIEHEVDGVIEREEEPRHSRVGDGESLANLQLTSKEWDDRAARPQNIAVSNAGKARSLIPSREIAREDDTLHQSLGHTHHIHGLDGLVSRDGNAGLNLLIQGGLDDILRTNDVRLDRLARVGFTFRHMLERRRVEDDVNASSRFANGFFSSREKTRTSLTPSLNRRWTMKFPKEPVPPVTRTVFSESDVRRGSVMGGALRQRAFVYTAADPIQARAIGPAYRGRAMSKPTTTVSIAMCTYNAVRFVDTQLESFLVQRRLPTELVVQDDGSSDGTAERVEAFAQRAPFPVSLQVNERRLGPTGNFERAMGRTSGDVVVLSDADDWWHPERIAASVQAFESRPTLGCVLSDAELVDGEGRPKGATLWQTLGFTPMEQYRFEHGDFEALLLRRTVGFGGTMALHRRVLDVALPIPRPWGHDNWALNIAVALFGVAVLPRSLMSYRQHGAQYSGTARTGLRGRIRAAREVRAQRDWVPTGVSFSQLLDRLERNRAVATDQPRLSRHLEAVRLKASHQLTREQLPPSKLTRLGPIIVELAGGRYSRFSNGLQSALRDLLIGAYRA